MVLVDTCVWIDFLKGISNPQVQLLEGLLQEGDAHICEIIFAEICFGASHKKQFEKYDGYFSGLPFLALPPAWHREAAKMGFILRKKGYKPFIADLLIALTALFHKTPLLTRDRDFEIYHQELGLLLE